MRMRRGFTLVELLVVIGIIALLISILLPALSSARKAAGAVKCAAALREIGNAHLMYVQENNGWSIPTKLLNSTYVLDDTKYTSGTPAYWQNFLQKYVTKSKVGYSAGQTNNAKTAQDAANARKSIFWGCPEWQGYNFASSSNPGDLSVIQTGYGWNAFPEYTPTFPPKNTNLNDNPTYKKNVSVVTIPITSTSDGTWYKFVKFTKPSERVLCGDALYWLMQTEYPTDANGTLLGCRVLQNSGAVTIPGTTTADWYRHGKYAGRVTSGGQTWFDARSGKVSYNILYADGHVKTSNDRADIWRAQRMRYPEP